MNKFFNKKIKLKSDTFNNTPAALPYGHRKGTDWGDLSEDNRNLIGLNISLKGRLKNANRSNKLRFNIGRIKKNTLNIFTHASKHHINTKTGVWMLKVYLLRSLNDKKI